MVPEIIDQRPQQKYENESIQVIKSISSIIKDVINQEKDTQGKSDFDNIVQKIKNQVPKDVKLSTPQIDNSELLAKITETVGNLLTDEEIESIVLLRNTTVNNVNSLGTTEESPATTTIIVEEETEESTSSPPSPVSRSPVDTEPSVRESEAEIEPEIELSTVKSRQSQRSDDDDEEQEEEVEEEEEEEEEEEDDDDDDDDDHENSNDDDDEIDDDDDNDEIDEEEEDDDDDEE